MSSRYIPSFRFHCLVNQAAPFISDWAKQLLLCSVVLLGMVAFPASYALPTFLGGQKLPSLAPMLDKVTPAVVNIATQGSVQVRNPLMDDPFFRRFFDLPNVPRQQQTQSLGSGVILDAKRGLVVTNNHVIANAEQITVKLRDGRELDAELVGTDPETDIAVVQLRERKDLVDIKTTDSDQLRVGDFVVAIGNPFGLGQTVTSGIVSALGRSGLGIEGYEDFIQTDASINPGNSGGALVDLNGGLIGINTAIFSQSGGNIGIGFAIPVNMVNTIVEQLVTHGEVRRGILGVRMQDLTPDLADAFNLSRKTGAVVVSVVPNSAADKAGLRAGDVILSVDDRKVDDAAEIRNRVGLLRVGEEVHFVILRNAREKSIVARIGEPEADSSQASVRRDPRLAGATFGDIPEDSPAYGKVKGVLIFQVERGSRLWLSGIRKGDIITSVNRIPIPTLQRFLDVVNREQSNGMLFRVRRGNGAAYVVVK